MDEILGVNLVYGIHLLTWVIHKVGIINMQVNVHAFAQHFHPLRENDLVMHHQRCQI